MARSICILAVFVIASAVAQADDCSSAGECPSEDAPNSVVSLLQTKLRIQALKDGGEDLSVGPAAEILSGGSQESAERMEAADPSASGLETLFIVVSDSHHPQFLRWISDSWGKNLSSSQLIAIGDGGSQLSWDHEKMPTMRVEHTRCEAHKLEGACCKTGEAVIMAHEQMEKQPNLKWVYIVEDDSYVRPKAMDKQLKHVDPVGTASRGTLVASHGCSLNCPNAVCGRGGLALSREALTTLVGNSPSNYLAEHMQTCNLCKMHGGASIGTLTHAHNITILAQNWWNPELGMHPHRMPKDDFGSALISAVEPAMYHPMKKEGQFKFLDQLFAEKHKSVEGLFLDQRFATQHKSVEDLGRVHCAKYNGNTVCTSDPDDVPWEQSRARLR